MSSLFVIFTTSFFFQTCRTNFQDQNISSSQTNLVVYVPEIISTLPHPGKGFTQGLIFHNDTLYESTGIYGHSSIRKMDSSGANYQEIIKIPSSIFAEGIAIHNELLYVLSWRENTCFIYDLNNNRFPLKEKIYYTGEGWGLCKDENSFWISSGSFFLTRVSLDDFSTLEKRKIFLNEAPLGNLNELEFVNGLILINVWQSNFAVIYDPQKDQTVGIIELEKLIHLERNTSKNFLSFEPEAVLNGIAYHKNSESLYITGKYWVNLFKIKLKLKDPSSFSIPQLRLLEIIEK